MINKFAKLQNSWFTKIILSVTALSFVSLFGVSGYYGMAGRNKAVLKVDNIELSQSEFSYLLQREMNNYKNRTGIEIDESGEQKVQIINALAKAKLKEAIIENTMHKYNIDFTRGLVQKVIFISPEFMNEGKFDPAIFKFYMSRAGMSEEELVTDIKRNMASKILLDDQLGYINVPEVLLEQTIKTISQRRTFKYMNIINDKAVIDRKPSQDELDQFYDDLTEEFMLPETRDITVLYLSHKDMMENMDISDEQIQAYYKEHIEDFEKPEQRHVLQMVFTSQDEANAAFTELEAGADFSALAVEYGQNADETDLGYVGSNDLSEELADAVFNLAKGQISEPLNIADSWQILKVTDVTAAEKMPHDQARTKIIAEIKEENLYDYSYEVMSEIEDKIGAGNTITDLSTAYKASLFLIGAMDEQGNAADEHVAPKSLLTDPNFIDAAFSYNEGETSQVVEVDDGLAVIYVDKIYEEHKLPREEADAKLRQLWLENERASITQELVDNIQHDLDAGDDMSVIAKRYALSLKNTMPITRNESFSDLSFVEIMSLFSAPKNEAQILRVGDDYIVAETTNVYDGSSSVSENEKDFIKGSLYIQMIENMSEALLMDYAADYKIEVNYQRMGLSDE